MKLASKKQLFFSILFLGILPSLLILFYYFDEETKLQEKEDYLSAEESDLLIAAKRDEDNILLHRACKGSAPNYTQTLAPMRFLEGSIEKQPLFKEIEFKQISPVTIKSSELKPLLEAIEDSKGPQIIVLDLLLERVPSLEQEDQFKIQTKLLKREFG